MNYIDRILPDESSWKPVHMCGLTRDQLNQVMLELQEIAEGCAGLTCGYDEGIFLAMCDAGRILAKAAGIEAKE